MGRDGIGRAARGVNAILAATTDANVDAIDTSLELAEKRRELELTAELATKTIELEQRLDERALLFELLRAATEKSGMDEVLPSVAARLGQALRLRELAILVRGDGNRFFLRALHGFSDPGPLLGRFISAGEGIAGEVTDATEPVVVHDVAAEPGYLAFWGAVEKSGSFAAVPIRHGGDNLGILALTRPESDPLTDVEVRFLSAVAATIALTIRHTALVDELRESSTHDELTGLANRRLLRARLEREIARARRYGTELALLMLDIDHFKQLNDRFGHPTGDAVLRDISRVLEDGVRSVDTVARAGGEEFVVLLPRTDAEAAARVADKLRELVAAHEVDTLEGKARITMSLGVALLQEGEGAASLLARADRALYDAKEAGRDRVRLSRPAA
jgi:diguanylate cyclase (GGDEF)-like protein